MQLLPTTREMSIVGPITVVVVGWTIMAVLKLCLYAGVSVYTCVHLCVCVRVRAFVCAFVCVCLCAWVRAREYVFTIANELYTHQPAVSNWFQFHLLLQRTDAYYKYILSIFYKEHYIAVSCDSVFEFVIVKRKQ